MEKPPPQALMVDPESFRGSPPGVTPNPDRRKCVYCAVLPACTRSRSRSSCTSTEVTVTACSELFSCTCRKLYEMAEIYGQVSAFIHEPSCA